MIVLQTDKAAHLNASVKADIREADFLTVPSIS
jgi:hypothetical protein